MDTANQIQKRNPIHPFPRAGAFIFFLLAFLTAGTALAVDRPPPEPQQLRAWLVGHLVTDMEALGTFDAGALAKVPAMVNALTDDQVALLAQYYYLARSKTEQDAYLYAVQQQGGAAEQVNAAKAEIADLLTVMNDQIEACYAEFATMPQAVQYLAQICYASVPGWCCNAGCYVPDWYYGNGCFVGPCFNAACSGPWAVPVYNAYYDHGSRFYTTYHNVARTVHVNRSTHLARQHADWLRHQGDWRNTLAHDRLLYQSRHTPPIRLPASTRNHIGRQAPSIRNPHAAVIYNGPNLARVGTHKPAVRQPKPQTSRAAAVRRAMASHARAPRAAAHVSHPRPAVHAHASRPTVRHASHPKPAAHAQAHARSGGHSKHR
jgi:hypothetical protein